MAKTHEINLGTKAFNNFINNEFIIVEQGNISSEDFILFKEVETIEGEISETGLFRMTQVKEIIHDDGLKDGFALLILTKF